MDRDAVIAWFADYLDTFAACTRGERDTSTMLDYYAVPMVFTMDTGVHALASREEVLAAAQQQVDGLRSAEYHHSDVLDSEVTVLNAVSCLYRGDFSRRRLDDGEIARLTATYLITDGPDGRRIAALVVHSA